MERKIRCHRMAVIFFVVACFVPLGCGQWFKPPSSQTEIRINGVSTTSPTTGPSTGPTSQPVTVEVNTKNQTGTVIISADNAKVGEKLDEILNVVKEANVNVKGNTTNMYFNSGGWGIAAVLGVLIVCLCLFLWRLRKHGQQPAKSQADTSA